MTASEQEGFSLIELMTALVVLSILVAIAIPSFQSLALTSQLKSISNDLAAAARLARSEAIKRNTVVTLCQSASGTACSTTGGWQQGWIVACRTSNNISCGATGTSWLVIQRQAAATSGMRVTATGGVSQLGFQPTGVGATTATFTVCSASPLGSQERVVTIDATGRSWLKKTETGVCS